MTAPVTDHADALIATYLEPHPFKADVAEARVKGRAVAVWALIGSYLLTPEPDALAQVAQGYQFPNEAVMAALAFYQWRQAAIDAKLARLDAS